MNELFLDTEVTGATNGTKGNPFTRVNRLCAVGCYINNRYDDFLVEYDLRPYGPAIREIGNLVGSADVLVGFNLKFDLHWLRRYGITFESKRVWDCQTFEYLVSRQLQSYPALGTSCEQRGLGSKIDVVKTEYWEKGLDTDQVPLATLKEYLQNDVEKLTRGLYLEQRKIFETLPQRLQTLIRLSNQDLLVLQECEWNGLPYNLEASHEESKKLEHQILAIEQELNAILGVDFVNWNSGYHISTILFGGVLSLPSRETYTFTYKDGRTKEKERPSRNEYVFHPLTAPVPGTELAKEGYYKTDEASLRKLKGGDKLKRIVELLLLQAKLEKLKGTYFDGFPKLHEQMDWEPNVLHGQLNQPVTTTGRLASNKPNQQNVPDPVRGLIESRYE